MGEVGWGGQQKWFGERRMVAVVEGGLRLMLAQGVLAFSWPKWERTPRVVRQNGTPGSQKRKGPQTKERDPSTSFRPTEDRGPSRPPVLPKQHQGEGPPSAQPKHTPDAFSGVSARHRSHLARIKMQTIHPNPGPQTRRGRRRRRERPQGERYVARRTRRDGRRKARKRGQDRDEEVVTVVTWNLQGVSLRANRMERMRRACQCIQRRGWEVTLLTEVRSEAFGTM